MDISNVTFLLFLFFFLAFSVRLYFYLNYFAGFAFSREKQIVDDNLPSVSVVIAAKNEENNLAKFLPIVLSQNYSNYEVIVVDDHSNDSSFLVLQDLQKRYSRLRIYKLKEGKKGKKKALLLGFSKARFPRLLLIDADCYPASERWIRGMVAKSESCDIILGYGRYQKMDGLLNMLIRYDTLLTGIRYLSLAKAGRAYMGVGRNLYYSREILDSSTAFNKYSHIAFGDDDLLVNEAATKSNTCISVSPHCHTISRASTTFKSFFLQKVRHLGAGKFYKATDQLILGIEGLSRAGFIILGIVLLLINAWLTLPFILVLLILQWMVLKKATDKLMDKDLVIFAPFLELFHFIFLLMCSFYSIFKRETTWK